MLRRPSLGWLRRLLPGARGGAGAAGAPAAGEPALTTADPGRFRVLFCGEEFPWGFEFTRQALAGDADIEVVRCRREDAADALPDADLVVPLAARLDAGALAAARRLKLILQFGVGLEGVDVPAATAARIWVSNIPSQATGNALSCAEMAVYLTLACLRSAGVMAASIRERRVGVPLGRTLFGRRVLVVGFGGIAKELVPRLKPFGCRLAAVRRSAWGGPADADVEALLDERGAWDDLPRLAAAADVIVLACVQTAETRGLVGAELLAACKPGVIVVNVSRGGLLDEAAARAALASGRLGALGLDVQAGEPVDPGGWLAGHPRVVLTPHVAGVTELSYRAMAAVVAAEARRARAGLPPSVVLNDVGGIGEEAGAAGS